MEEQDVDVIRWGILSTADIGRKKVIPGLKKARPLRGRGDRLARRGAWRGRWLDDLDIPTAHGSYEALLADPQVDAVYIPLPNHLHAEWTIAAARAGKHVLCEKPLAMTAADAERMLEVCSAEGVRLMEAFMYRHHPSWVAARDVVASGRIGRLRSVQSWFSYYNDDPANIRNQFEAGGGALFDIGCYAVNLSRMLFDAEPTGVRAAIVREAPSGVDVLTSAILEFGRRRMATASRASRARLGWRRTSASTSTVRRDASRSRSRSTSRPTARRRYS